MVAGSPSSVDSGVADVVRKVTHAFAGWGLLVLPLDIICVSCRFRVCEPARGYRFAISPSRCNLCVFESSVGRKLNVNRECQSICAGGRWDPATNTIVLPLLSIFCPSFCRIDWNLMLDFDGGPNHAGNLCDSPIVSDKVCLVDGNATFCFPLA